MGLNEHTGPNDPENQQKQKQRRDECHLYHSCAAAIADKAPQGNPAHWIRTVEVAASVWEVAEAQEKMRVNIHL